jgi:hypothetical protein
VLSCTVWQVRVSLLQVTLDRRVDDPGRWDSIRVLVQWTTLEMDGSRDLRLGLLSAVLVLGEDNSCGSGGVEQDYYGMSWLVWTPGPISISFLQDGCMQSDRFPIAYAIPNSPLNQINRKLAVHDDFDFDTVVVAFYRTRKRLISQQTLLQLR